MPPFTPPPLQPSAAAQAPRWRVAPHKILLALVLIFSVFVFLLLLLVGAVAILREAAPGHHAGLARLILAMKHLILHRILHLGNHR